jgi:hypothetical protein
MGYDVRHADAPVQLELAVVDGAGEVLAKREVSQSIVDVLSVDTSRRLLPAGHREMTIRGTLNLSERSLEQIRIILAVFDREMILEAREVVDPVSPVMRAELELPPLEVGSHSLHMVLKRGEGDDARRVAEEKITLQVLPPVD